MLRPPSPGITTRVVAAARAFRDVPAAPNVDPPPYLPAFARHPWVRFGAAVIVGYAAGSITRRRAAGSLARKALLFAATAIVRDVFDGPPRP